MKKRKVFIVVILVIILCGGVYFLYDKNYKVNEEKIDENLNKDEENNINLVKLYTVDDTDIQAFKDYYLKANDETVKIYDSSNKELCSLSNWVMYQKCTSDTNLFIIDGYYYLYDNKGNILFETMDDPIYGSSSPIYYDKTKNIYYFYYGALYDLNENLVYTFEVEEEDENLDLYFINANIEKIDNDKIYYTIEGINKTYIGDLNTGDIISSSVVSTVGTSYKMVKDNCDTGYKLASNNGNILIDECSNLYTYISDNLVMAENNDESAYSTLYIKDNNSFIKSKKLRYLEQISNYYNFYDEENNFITYDNNGKIISKDLSNISYYLDDMYVGKIDNKYYFLDKDLNIISNAYEKIHCYDNWCTVSDSCTDMYCSAYKNNYLYYKNKQVLEDKYDEITIYDDYIVTKKDNKTEVWKK